MAESRENSLLIVPTNGPNLNGATLTTRVRHFNDHRLEELHRVLTRHSGERHLVILQDFPDPDALSSAWAYLLIAQQYDIRCDLVYTGIISHQENIALVKLTGMPVQNWSPTTLKDRDWSCYQGCVFIDNQGATSQLTPWVRQIQLPVIAVIDHHSQGEIAAEFVDIRPNVKATATILTQYLQGELLVLDRNVSDHVKCATALIHGIRSDTQALLQAQEEDLLAVAYLTRYHDPQLLRSILQVNRSKQAMDVIERALKNRIIQNNFSLAGVGYLRYDARDAIPQAADFLVTEDNVHTAVVYGIVYDKDRERELVIGSLRTTKLTLDPDEFLKEAFGHDPQGRFFGGGRSQAGGFEIPMGFLAGLNDNPNYANLKWEVYDTQIKQKLLRLINPDRPAPVT
ncbi:MAG: bifunctional oligoribonuclease/PAP phosphatase NrnA [Gloeomargarita sp. SKYBB_i_bin120]|nr:bifunctional oligoribonuclease/PAP phosphatase NrnA [Gloeomargarita sp. SKYG98]MCS7291944.1 bifunctional oligoribonuclease/PAP phosphatase NrnA [Gloeomargarita sp. SKYB120]MDW8177504.1 bifunctional oligoribonuclease/PAP phosphatase NrnA [Gloeomargarita sp. SKYBB_i_bin120]